jgi:hypothetical protein
VFVLSGRGLCDGPIPRPENSYRLWCVWVRSSGNEQPRHLLWVGRRGKDCEMKHYIYFIMYYLCCRSLVQRIPTDCGVSECDQVKMNNLDTCCE